MEDVDVLVIGAGLAGLSCARTLQEAGKRVLVLERSSRVGGRCASKTAGASPVLDFGPVFVHGDDPDFLAWVESVAVGAREGWPRVVEGRGTPCQPRAFDPLQSRWALPDGIRGLAEDLVQGTPLVLEALVERLEWTPDGFSALTTDGRRFRGRDGVVALALEQTAELLGTLPGDGARGALALLAQFRSLPCLTLLADYPQPATPPPWDIFYPEGVTPLLLVSHETSKGRGQGGTSLVIQARPGWSAERLGIDRDAWSRELLAAAAELVGPWAAEPRSLVAHRWKYARLGPSDHLVRPLLLSNEGWPSRLGLAGDLFDPDGGLQGAWRSGRQLAQRLLEV